MISRSVYFIECAGRIKIGFSSNVAARMLALATGSASDLHLIATITGTHRLERAIHRHLKAHRVKGEWFTDCALVRSTIDELVAKGPDAIGFVDQDPSPKRPPSDLQIAITSLIKQKTPYGTTPREILCNATGLHPPAAKHRLNNRSSYSVDELRALFRSEDGFDYLKAVMADARPPWWVPLRGLDFAPAKGRRG